MRQLPIPAHFKPEKVDQVWRVSFQKIARRAEAWSNKYDIDPAADDHPRICLVPVDMQNSFCLPEFSLFVRGKSGKAAVRDTSRLCRFIYRNLPYITQISPTMDTHQAIQIFHSAFWVDQEGNHPEPHTRITLEDLLEGKWRLNTPAASTLGLSEDYLERYVQHYLEELKHKEKYDLTIWPYHVMLGSISHAMVPALAETTFFHSIARYSKPDYHIKGGNPLTEHYSVFGPEVTTDHRGQQIAERSESFIKDLLSFDAVIIAGEAKSHCVAWTIEDLLQGIKERDSKLAEKVYLLEDCTSPVVVPDVMDYTKQADEAFRRFSRAGMHIVQSTEPLVDWEGLDL